MVDKYMTQQYGKNQAKKMILLLPTFLSSLNSLFEHLHPSLLTHTRIYFVIFGDLTRVAIFNIWQVTPLVNSALNYQCFDLRYYDQTEKQT